MFGDISCYFVDRFVFEDLHLILFAFLTRASFARSVQIKKILVDGLNLEVQRSDMAPPPMDGQLQNRLR